MTTSGDRAAASASGPPHGDAVDWWVSAYGNNAVGGYEWVGTGLINAEVENVAGVLLAVRPGRVGPDNVAMLNTVFWSRMSLAGGPLRFVGRLGEATMLVETDPAERTFVLQGRLGWRIVTQLEPHSKGVLVVRRIQHLSLAKRAFVPLLRQTPFGLDGDLRRLSQAVRRA